LNSALGGVYGPRRATFAAPPRSRRHRRPSRIRAGAELLTVPRPPATFPDARLRRHDPRAQRHNPAPRPVSHAHGQAPPADPRPPGGSRQRGAPRGGGWAGPGPAEAAAAGPVWRGQHVLGPARPGSSRPGPGLAGLARPLARALLASDGPGCAVGSVRRFPARRGGGAARHGPLEDPAAAGAVAPGSRAARLFRAAGGGSRLTGRRRGRRRSAWGRRTGSWWAGLRGEITSRRAAV
jgi:hypothetical protein